FADELAAEEVAAAWVVGEVDDPRQQQPREQAGGADQLDEDEAADVETLLEAQADAPGRQVLHAGRPALVVGQGHQVAGGFLTGGVPDPGPAAMAHGLLVRFPGRKRVHVRHDPNRSLLWSSARKPRSLCRPGQPSLASPGRIPTIRRKGSWRAGRAFPGFRP